MYNAIFFNDSYLLLPASTPDWESFSADLHGRKLPATYQMIPLLEDNRIRCGAQLRGQCMAPCFLTDGRNDPLPVTIADPASVYPAGVELMTAAEYNARLRQVILRHCAGCGGYAPIDDTVESLHGHHSEISLNGVCFYRWTQEEERFVFHEDLTELCDTFAVHALAQQSASIIRATLDAFTHDALHLIRKKPAADGAVMLYVSHREDDPLAPALLETVRGQVQRRTQGAVLLTAHDAPDLTPGGLRTLLSRQSRAALRESCARHHCALADLLWTAQEHSPIYASLRRMESQQLLHILYDGPGRALLLLIDPPTALKALRYRTPLLQPHNASITVHSALHSRCYAINFDMPFTPLD